MPDSSVILAREAAFEDLPPVWPADLLDANRAAAAARTLVVLDDDPTGTQTVRDVPVITVWDVPTLRDELRDAPACFYILTNSRSLSGDASLALHRELAANLRTASQATGRAFSLVSRSDSTLRGHYPLETDTLASELGPFDATLLIPYFEAGGRFTLNDTHYVAEGEQLVPAADTPFARDAAFGYRHSHLPSWVEEKTGGRIRAADVVSLSLDLIRRGGPAAVAARLQTLADDAVCIANACAPRDIEVIAAATLEAEAAGSRCLYRTAASFVAARIGQSPQSLLGAADLSGGGTHGGLVVVGSYVPKTTAQLQRLLARPDLTALELDVASLLDPSRRNAALADARARLSSSLPSGRDCVLYTSRQVITSDGAAGSLDIGRQVSSALTELVQSLTVRPRFLIAKGGITSSDTATVGLGVRRAIVRGQLLPGVPVWRLGPESKYPDLDYVVFPGNVGDENALLSAVGRFSPAQAIPPPLP